MTSNLDSLLPIIKRWEQMNTEFTKRVPKDALYWFSERVNCGALATAAWLEKGVALAEYGDDKEWEGKPRRGRVDLWIKTASDETFLIEAKQCWPCWSLSASSPSEIEAELQSELDSAVRDAKRVLPSLPADMRLGIVFAVPAIRENSPDEQMRRFQEAHEGLDNLDLHEWIPVDPTLKWKDRLYPGILLLGRVADSSPSS